MIEGAVLLGQQDDVFQNLHSLMDSDGGGGELVCVQVQRAGRGPAAVVGPPVEEGSLGRDGSECKAAVKLRVYSTL